MANLVLRAGKGSPLTNAEVDANFTNLDAAVDAAALTASWASVTGKPSTLTGYGITDGQPLDGDLTAIAALAGTTGLLRKTAANTWSLDTSAYLTGITSGQVTTALGFTPYNATNPSGYITSSASITGNAATATALATGRTIAMTGDVAWTSATFNGSANVTGTATLANSGVTAGTYRSVTVDAKGRVTAGSNPTTLSGYGITDAINVSQRAVANGVATLDSAGLVPASQLPSYVDDVLEYANLAGFPATGETGKIYVAIDTNKTYRWSGTVYTYITSGAVDSVAGKTGVVTLVKGDVGLGSVDNTADSAKNVLSATKLTTARTIGGVSFDGTANINLPGVNAAGNQSTTGSAATLTTTRTIWGQNFNGSANVAGALSGVTTLGMSGQLTSTLATGTAPLVVASTTRVANLNVATAGNADTVTNGVYTTGDQTINGLKAFATATLPNNGSYLGGGAYYATDAWRNYTANQNGWAIRNTNGIFTLFTGASNSAAAAGTAFTDFQERVRVDNNGTASFLAGGNQLLLKNSNASDPTVIHRADGSNYYILLSAAGTSANGTWNALRPLTISQTTGLLSSSNGQLFAGGMTTPAQITSTVAVGTAPFVVTSTTRVANLNVASAGNADTVTNGVYTTGNQTIGGNKTFSGLVTFGAQGGTEGGEVHFAQPASGTNFGSVIAQDVQANSVRWFATYSGSIKLFSMDFAAAGGTLLTSGNYGSYAPTLTGTGASGTWGIGITGNAATVTNGVYTNTAQTITGLKTFSGGAIFGSTFYPNYQAVIDFGSAAAGTWVRIAQVISPNVEYSTIGFRVVVLDPQSNHMTTAAADAMRSEIYDVACVRTNATVLNDPDACFVRGPGNRIRAVKTAVGTYEIQIQNAGQFREYRVDIRVIAFNGGHTVAYFAGDTAAAGTAQYNASVSTTATDFFQNVSARQLTSSVATGTAPFVVASTTRVANLNVATAGTADNAANITGGNQTGSYEVTSGQFTRFGHASQSDANDGRIGAGLFATGLNIVGTQTSAGSGRQIRLYGSVIDGSGTAYVLNTGSWGISVTGSAATLTTGRTIALTGDVTYTSGSFNGSANVTGTATLANSGVTAGTYPKVTVDAKGRVTAGAALASADLPTYTGTITSSQITTGLGFTPVQQGGGTSQLTNKLYMGWSAGSVLRLQIDSTDFGGTWPIGVSGNAATATTLATARTIGGVSFNGSANINLPGVNTTGNQNTTGSAATLTTARTINGVSFNGSANIDTTEWFHSDRDFPNGTLITTNINYAVTDGDPFVLEIRGNSYGNIVPLDLLYQGYIYSNTIISHGGISNGLNISGLVAINNGGNLCFWFPSQGYWNGYNVKVYTAYATRATNRVTSITGVAKPTTAKEVALSSSIRQSLHSGNFSSYALPLSGGTLTGQLSLNGGDSARILQSSNSSAGGPAQFFIEHSATNVRIGNARGEIVIPNRTTISTSGLSSSFVISDTGGNGANILLAGDGGTTPNKFLRAQGGNFQVLNSGYTNFCISVTDGGNFTALGTVTGLSDERLKKDWAALPSDFIERLAAVKSGTYTRIDSGDRQAGSSAQEWQALLPEVVLTGTDKNQTLSLAYGNAALVSVVELAKDNIDLRARLAKLEALVQKLIGE